MLRTIFVLALIGVGGYYALQTPFYALLFYIGNAYFRPEDWVWTNLVANLKLSLVSGVWLILISLATRQKFVWSWRIGLLGLYLFHTFLSSLASEHFSYSIGYWTDFFKTIVITYMIVVLVTDYSKFRLTILVMVMGLGLEQAKQGWFYLVTSPTWHNENVLANFGDNNVVAVGMLALVPLVGLLSQTTGNRWAKTLYGITFVGCLYRALSTHSRGGLLALFAMAGVWWLRSRHKLGALVCGLLVSLIVIPNLPETFWSRMHTIQTFEKEQDESALGRFHFWNVAVDMANAHPVLGIGYFAYTQAYNKYDSSGGRYGPWRAVHSSYFAVLAELGYPGAILYLIILFGALRTCSRVYKRALRHPQLVQLGTAALSLQISLIAFLVGGSFVSSQSVEMLWHIIGLSIALERITITREAEVVAGGPVATVSPITLPKTVAAA